VNLVKRFLKNLMVRNRPTVDYTHWDIHALARVIDPVAWVPYDATPGAYYMDFPEAYASFKRAIPILAAGYKAPWGHLWSDAELEAHISRSTK